jgi:periplasmic divalent cation tolerance protein
VVLITCGTATEADRIAWALVEKRLAACVNVFDARVRSTYRWQGKVETAAEFLLLVKTARRLLPRLEAEVKRLHSYDVPEMIALPVAAGSKEYLGWLESCLLAGSQVARGRRKKS